MIYGISLNKNNRGTLCAELIKILREKILKGDIKNGEKLPSSRVLSRELGVARNTVVEAFEQLIAEGYLETRSGSGTYVKVISNLSLYRSEETSTENERVKAEFPKGTIVFDTGTPDNTLFPTDVWGATLKRVCQAAPARVFGYADKSGIRELKEALCRYLYRSRGVAAAPKNLFVVSGTSGGLSLIADVFSSGGRKIAVENPCMDFVTGIFSVRGYVIYPVPVDREGMISTRLSSVCEQPPSLIYTVPSHQFPTGAVLSASRRLELLEYATKKSAYIIEDDYDSEYNYCIKPIQSLYSLERQRTIYVGTFSKIFSPAIRLGYIIVPDALIARFEKTAEQMNIGTDALTQLAMAEIIDRRLLDRHIYKMKKVYAAKRKLIIECVQKSFGSHAEILGENAGLHLLVCLDKEISQENILKSGVYAESADYYSSEGSQYKNTIILGYGNLNDFQIETGVERLSKALGYN